jgi:hypothetical protein
MYQGIINNLYCCKYVTCKYQHTGLSFKAEAPISNSEDLSLCLKENTTLLHYKYRLENAVQENNCFALTIM